MSTMIKTALLISDLLFPLWLIVLMIILKRHGVSTWKAWGLTSSFCLAQAYFVAKVVGWNVGGYLIVFVSSVPDMILGKGKISEGMASALFWIIPPIVFIVFPSLILYLLAKGKTMP
jgi:hypothetical protein